MASIISPRPRWTLARCLRVCAAVYVAEFFSDAQRVLSVVQTDSWADLMTIWIRFGMARVVAALTVTVLCYLVGSMNLPRRQWLVAAPLVLAASVATLCAFHSYFSPFRFGLTSSSSQALFLYNLWIDLVCSLLTLGVLDRLSRTEEADRRVRALQDEDRAARQRVAQSRLQAIQARIDPQLLFDVLSHVQQLYGHNVARAEQLLDQLIVFLRAALPRLRTAHSSLAEEFDLAESYERIQQLVRQAPASMRVALPANLRKNVFPPGVMLPLAASVIGAADSPSVDLSAEQTSDRTRVRIDSACLPDGATLARVRRVLADLYGPLAALQTETQDDRFRTEIEVPLELVA